MDMNAWRISPPLDRAAQPRSPRSCGKTIFGGTDNRGGGQLPGPGRRGHLRAGRRAAGPRPAAADPPERGRALVRRRPAGPPGERGLVHVHRRDQGAAAPVAASAGHGGRGGALRLPRRPVGPAAADQLLPGRHHVRPGRGRAGRDRAGPRGARARHRDRAGRAALRRLRPAPADLGAHRRGGQLPARPHPVRHPAAGSGRARRLRRRHGQDRRRAWRARPAAHRGRTRRPDRPVPRRAGRDRAGPRGGAVPAAQPAAAGGRPGALRDARRGRGVAAARLGPAAAAAAPAAGDRDRAGPPGRARHGPRHPLGHQRAAARPVSL